MTHLLDTTALLAHFLDENPHFDAIPGLKMLRLSDK